MSDFIDRFARKWLQVRDAGDPKLEPLTFSVVDVAGKREPVLLLHGFPDSAEVWRQQIPALQGAGFRVIVPDLRGFGDSAKPQDVEAYRLDRIVGDVVGILGQLGISSVHIVGHDWGAAVGWAMALGKETRDAVRSLVAMSVGHPLTYKKPTIEQREKSWYIYFFQHERAEQAIQRDPDFLVDWSGYPPEVDRWRRSLQGEGALRAALNWYRANASPDPARSIVDQLANLRKQGDDALKVRIPTLGVWSTRDPHLTEEPVKSSEQWVAQPGSWEYRRVNAGHWLQLERWGVVNAMLLEFLDRSASKASPSYSRSAA
jgi:pimeloyl-ACP methyl ester carboxylesterase